MPLGFARSNAKTGMMNFTDDACRCNQLKIAVAMGQICHDMKGAVQYGIHMLLYTKYQGD